MTLCLQLCENKLCRCACCCACSCLVRFIYNVSYGCSSVYGIPYFKMYLRMRTVISSYSHLYSVDLVPTISSPLSEVCDCSSTPAILSAVVAVIITALLATIIFMVVQVVICKCHPKFRPGGTETGASAGGEGQEYEQVDVEGCNI